MKLKKESLGLALFGIFLSLVSGNISMAVDNPQNAPTAFVEEVNIQDIPTVEDYLQYYNYHRGYYFRDHSYAQVKLREKFDEVLKNVFHSSLPDFYRQTQTAFDRYIENRGYSKLALDFLSESTSKKCLETLESFMQEKIKEVNVSDIPEASKNSWLELLRQTGHPLSPAQADYLWSNAVKLSLAIGAAGLYVYMPVVCVAATGKAFPYIWVHVLGFKLPAVGTAMYNFVYLPALMHAQGQAYIHSNTVNHLIIASIGAASVSASFLSYAAEVASRKIHESYRFFSKMMSGNNLREGTVYVEEDLEEGFVGVSPVGL